ncbi:hypothetical protein IRT45_32340 [Nocardia sp. BSTN01]|uniref:hypothetical protein n=1 Tax=Nocardia sp. BSTN01 TaxID=2783665 RepID=UPI001890A71D|nr:hypothetical protein [Nocardia sp. BSTN01]MBF5001819.1 hypothetical protein [Nocardia sp. BSTN01]
MIVDDGDNRDRIQAHRVVMPIDSIRRRDVVAFHRQPWSAVVYQLSGVNRGARGAISHCLTVPAGRLFAERRIRLLVATGCYVPNAQYYRHAGLMSWLRSKPVARGTALRRRDQRIRIVNGRVIVSEIDHGESSHSAASGGAVRDEPALSPAAAREAVNQQGDVAPELWTQAAALLSADLDDV